MIIYYFNSEKTSYFDGPKEEAEKFHPGFIEVVKCPGWEYVYNFQEKKWEKNADVISSHWHPERNKMLKETSWTIDALDAPFTEPQKVLILNYRQELIDLLNGDVTQKTFPEIPEFLKPWINI